MTTAKTYRVQYKGRANVKNDAGEEIDNGEPTGEWADIGDQPEGMTKAEATAYMNEIKGTDDALTVRVKLND